jgi:DNA-directed RNA polymerase subunit F
MTQLRCLAPAITELQLHMLTSQYVKLQEAYEVLSELAKEQEEEGRYHWVSFEAELIKVSFA